MIGKVGDRGRRARGVPRARTIATKKLTREELRVGALLNPPVDFARPKTRGECAPCDVCQQYVDGAAAMPVGDRLPCGHPTDEAPNHSRPCGWLSCDQHLYLDVNPETGSIKLNFPSFEPWELKHSCTLDVADRGGITLEDIGEIMNLTRERIRQIEVRGYLQLRARALERGIDEESLACFPHPEGHPRSAPSTSRVGTAARASKTRHLNR